MEKSLQGQRFMLIFTDKSSREITEEQKRMVERSLDKDYICLDGQYYKTFMLGKVLSIEDYYREYPDKRPENTNYTFIPEMVEGSTGLLTEKPEPSLTTKPALSGIIKGIENYMGSEQYKGSNATKIMLDKYKKRLTNK